MLRGRCLPYGEGITYFPVVEAIKQAAGLADFDLPEVVESKVCSVLDGDEHQELVCRHVSQLMGVAESAAGEDTFWAIRRFFEASARERPLVLVFDDIHWGEPTFLDLVEHIADWSRGSPILLLCMARSDLLDVRPSWGGGKLNAATVSLEPLTDDQSADLIANLLGTTELPADIAERIVRTAEGNPLFVEEMLAMLVDDGLHRPRRRPVDRGRRPLLGRRPALDPRAVGLAARPPDARGARGARGGRRDRQGVLRGRRPRPGPRGPARARSVRPAVARPQGADPVRADDACRARTRSGSGTCSCATRRTRRSRRPSAPSCTNASPTGSSGSPARPSRSRRRSWRTTWSRRTRTGCSSVPPTSAPTRSARARRSASPRRDRAPPRAVITELPRTCSAGPSIWCRAAASDEPGCCTSSASPPGGSGTRNAAFAAFDEAVEARGRCG